MNLCGDSEVHFLKCTVGSPLDTEIKNCTLLAGREGTFMEDVGLLGVQCN